MDSPSNVNFESCKRVNVSGSIMLFRLTFSVPSLLISNTFKLEGKINDKLGIPSERENQILCIQRFQVQEMNFHLTNL